MPRRGSFLNPLIFAVACALIGALMSGVFNEAAQALPGMQTFRVNTGFVPNVMYGFVGAVIGLVVITCVYHLFVRLLVGRNNGGLGATFRVLCYVQAVQLLTWLPLLNLLAGIYGLYLSAFGFREVHSTTYGRAAAVVALPLLLIIVLAFLFGLAVAPLLFSR